MKRFTVLATALWPRLTAAQTPFTLTVNVSTTYQTIDGFGFSQAFGRAQEFQNLASPAQAQGLDLLFSPTTGAGMTIIRNRIGSGNYTGGSILPVSPGSPTATPAYVFDGNDAGQVWLSKQAMAYGVKAIYADAWSAPGFMKTNGDEANGGYLCGTPGHGCESGDWRQAYADFLVRYVQFYKDEGIPITHLGFLNEPDLTTSYSSMRITIDNPVEVSSFVPTLYNAINAAGLGSVKIACCDTVSWSNAKTVTAALAAFFSHNSSSYIGLLTSHMYGNDPTSLISTTLGNLPPVWQTEGADLNSAWCTTWYSNGGPCEGMTWASKISQGILDANLSAYIYWQGLEIDEPQSSSYLVAVLDGETATPSGRLWAFAMWSRFIRPGAVRVATSGTISGVAVGAFKNVDGSVVAVFTNSGDAAQKAAVGLEGFEPDAASAWLTDNEHAVSATGVTLQGGAATADLPARSVVTLRLTGSS